MTYNEMKKASFCSIVLTVIAISAHAQLPELSAPKVLPESPAAAAITRYIEYPVDLSNGLVQISIPLYEIVEGDIRIPISLSFHASGLRPNMRSSCWLGDGWSLSTGPSLSRSIAGGADEYFYNSTIAETASPTWYQLSQVASQAADVTLDEYHYSLLGSAGRMYIRNPDRTTRKAVTIPDDPVKVEFLSSPDWFSVIRMTDKAGMRYTFGGNGCYDRIPHSFGGSYHEPQTSWKIREIRSAATGRTVRFSYSSPVEEIVSSRWTDAVTMVDQFAGQMQNTIPAVLSSAGGSPEDNTFYRFDNISRSLVETTPDQLTLPDGYTFPSPSRQDIVQRNSYPQRIDFSEGHIEFVRHSGSASAYGHAAGSYLSEIQIYDLFGTLVRKIILSQTCNALDFTLRLNSVTICGPHGEDAQTWSFTYEGLPLPRDTRGLDRWGYYNGHDSNTTLVPDIVTTAVVHNFPVGMDEQVDVTIPGGDRSCNEAAMKRGMLTAITYPTGGRTEFSYEAHRYLDESNTVQLAGGLRIRQIRDVESDGSVMYRNFRYSTAEDSVNGAGLLNVIPAGGSSSAWYPKDSLMYRETACSEFGGSLGALLAIYKERVWTDESLVGLTGDVGSSVSYPFVTETRSSDAAGNSTIGRTVHCFDIVQSHPMKVGTTGMVSDSREGWKSGEKLAEKTYRASGSTAAQNSMTYNHEYGSGDASTRVRQMQVYRTARVYGIDEMLVPEQYREIQSITTDLSQGRSLPASRTETLCETNGSITRSTAYTHDAYGNVKTVTESGLGIPGFTSRITTTKYAHEMTGSVYSDMAAANMLSVPVETNVYRNSTTDSNLLTTQATAFGKYQRGQSSSRGYFFAPSSQTLTIRGNTASTREIKYNTYDYRGNAIETETMDGQRTVHLWGYGGTHPVAQVQGSSWNAVKSHADTTSLNIGSAASIGTALTSLRDTYSSNSGVHVTTLTWEPLLGVASMADPSGRTSDFTWDALGRLTSSSLEGCTLESYAYFNGSGEGDNKVIATRYLSEDGSRSSDTYSFYDRLGRPVETLLAGGSEMNGVPQDIVTLSTYDAFGREAKQYAPTPFAVSGSRSSGDFVTQAQIEVQSFMFHDWDVYAYSEKHHEDSPLSRVTEEYGPGSPWHTHGKSVRTENLVNTASGDLACGKYELAAGDLVRHYGVHAAGQLSAVRTTDEDGHVTTVFTDKLGRTVLERRKNGSQNLDTYYIYDELGLLCYVLTPEASAAMASNGTYSETSAPMAGHAYIYHHDVKGRCVLKKLPGIEPVYIRYDKADRPVFTQDGVQRLSGKWTYAVCDFLGREALRGVWNSASVPDISGTVTRATFNGGWSININRPDGSLILAENYYDDHSFLNALPSATRAHLSADTMAGYGVPDTGTGRDKGLVTGSRVWSLDDPAKAAVTAVYSDSFGRMTQSHTAEALGGWRDVHLLNSLTGKPLGSLETATLPSGQANSLETGFSYDQQDRPVWESASLDGSASQETFLSYDGIGRLASKALTADGGGAGDVEETYAHNVRGWLTEQHSTLFHSSLRYDETTLGTDGLYSGNIAEWEWRRGPGSQANAWALSYDGASRMTDARRYTGSLASSANMTASTSAEVNPFSERAISYDRNGNITALTRYGQAAASAEDILAYTYSGNRIASIANTGTLGGGGSYSHDANGNVTHDGLAGLDLQYNLLNLTKRISSGGTTLADYHYLADGTRAAAERGDGTGVQYRGSLIYTKEADGGLELDCALTSGGRIANDAGTLQVQHFIRDHLGSVRTVVDGSTGDVLETSDYLPFGKRWDLTGGQAAQTITDPTNRWRFSGKETQSFYNPAIPYNDFGARLHDPRTGRWLGVDPLAEKYYSLSMFGYCAGNPIKNTDYNGADIWDKIAGVFIGVTSNVLPVPGLRDAYSPNDPLDYNSSLMAADKASTMVGEAMIAAGIAASAAGTDGAAVGLAVTASGVGTPEGIAISAVSGTAAVAGDATALAGGYLMFNAQKNSKEGYNRGDRKKSPNQINNEIKKGKAPSSFERVDVGKTKGEQQHIHFKDKSALNMDGSWKHGTHTLTRTEQEYLKNNGWQIK